jgi:hypothetical protein
MAKVPARRARESDPHRSRTASKTPVSEPFLRSWPRACNSRRSSNSLSSLPSKARKARLSVPVGRAVAGGNSGPIRQQESMALAVSPLRSGAFKSSVPPDAGVRGNREDPEPPWRSTPSPSNPRCSRRRRARQSRSRLIGCGLWTAKPRIPLMSKWPARRIVPSDFYHIPVLPCSMQTQRRPFRVAGLAGIHAPGGS